MSIDMKFAGVVASIKPIRLMRVLESMEVRPFPIFCYCQGYSESSREMFLIRFPDINFVFVEKLKYEANMIYLYNCMYDLVKGYEYVYLFDDDFKFHDDSIGEIVSAVDDLDGDPVVGAIIYNRNYEAPLIHKPSQFAAYDAGNNYYCYKINRNLIGLWNSAGILFRSNAFQPFENAEKYCHGNDTSLLLKMVLNGYKILGKDINITHRAGMEEDSYYKVVEGKMFGEEQKDIFWSLRSLNYLNAFEDKGLLVMDHRFCATRLTLKGYLTYFINNIKLRRRARVSVVFECLNAVKESTQLFFYWYVVFPVYRFIKVNLSSDRGKRLANIDISKADDL